MHCLLNRNQSQKLNVFSTLWSHKIHLLALLGPFTDQITDFPTILYTLISEIPTLSWPEAPKKVTLSGGASRYRPSRGVPRLMKSRHYPMKRRYDPMESRYDLMESRYDPIEWSYDLMEHRSWSNGIFVQNAPPHQSPGKCWKGRCLTPFGKIFGQLNLEAIKFTLCSWLRLPNRSKLHHYNT